MPGGMSVGSPKPDGGVDGDDSKRPPFTPKGMLIMFTAMNVLTYYDRGVLSSVLDVLEREDQMGLSGVYQGLLGNAYMLGYVAASPVFARLAKKFHPLRMIAIGLGVWTYSTAASGLAPNFWVLFFARALTGVGEASFLCLAPPFIDKFAPVEKRSAWLSIFFTAIPVGLALGFGFSSVWVGEKVPFDNTSGFGLMDKEWGWRSAFIMESILMLPFVIVCATRKGHLSFDDDEEDEEKRDVRERLLVEENLLDEEDLHTTGRERAATVAKKRELKVELLALARNPLYVCIVLGYAAQTFVTGGFAFFGKEYLVDALGFKDSEAGVLFGLTTAAMGIVGTGFGGWFVDRLRNAPAAAEEAAGVDDLTAAAAGAGSGANSTAAFDRNLVLVTTAVLIFSTLTWPAGVLAFVMASYKRGLFFLFLAISEFFLFASLTPCNNAIMWSVPFDLNPLAIAMSVVVTHMLGDAASPIIIGAVRDSTQNWNLTMILASCWLVWSVIFFVAALYFARKRAARHGVTLAKGELILFDGSDSDDGESSSSGLLAGDERLQARV